MMPAGVRHHRTEPRCLRREPLERRKTTHGRLLAHAGHGVQLNEYLEAEGPLVFEHACRMGLEGVVSKRNASLYHSGRSRHWEPHGTRSDARLAEEDWGSSPAQGRKRSSV
jgi:hypothetical protein